MTKHVPLFLPLGSIRLLTIFFSFCIIFVHPALADKMAESPELFDTAFTMQERLDIPDGFVQREMVYISILLGTLVLCLFFFFMQRRMKKLRERDRERYLQLFVLCLQKTFFASKGTNYYPKSPRPPPDFSTNYEEKPSFSDGFLP